MANSVGWSNIHLEMNEPIWKHKHISFVQGSGEVCSLAGLMSQNQHRECPLGLLGFLGHNDESDVGLAAVCRVVDTNYRYAE